MSIIERAIPALAIVGVLFGGVVGIHVLMAAPIHKPPTEITVHALFPDDLVQDWEGPDDHGWWGYAIRPDSSADPEALCEQILGELSKRWPLTFPGIGVWLASESAFYGGGGGITTQCGHPEWFVQDPGA